MFAALQRMHFGCLKISQDLQCNSVAEVIHDKAKAKPKVFINTVKCNFYLDIQA